MRFMHDATAPQLAPPRHWRSGADPQILDMVTEPDVHTALWERTLDPLVAGYAQWLVAHPIELQGSVDEVVRHLPQGLGRDAFGRELNALSERFATWMGAPGAAELRTVTTDKCAKFHVDYYALRLITTYVGAGTEWLPEEHVDPAAFARREVDIAAFNRSIAAADAVRRLDAGHVLVMRGRGWPGPVVGLGGTVHRSPPIQALGGRRLVLSLTA